MIMRELEVDSEEAKEVISALNALTAEARQRRARRRSALYIRRRDAGLLII
jgi:hypothetical protein